jgi:hypothetical protein
MLLVEIGLRVTAGKGPPNPARNPGTAALLAEIGPRFCFADSAARPSAVFFAAACDVPGTLRATVLLVCDVDVFCAVEVFAVVPPGVFAPPVAPGPDFMPPELGLLLLLLVPPLPPAGDTDDFCAAFFASVCALLGGAGISVSPSEKT